MTFNRRSAFKGATLTTAAFATLLFSMTASAQVQSPCPSRPPLPFTPLPFSVVASVNSTAVGNPSFAVGARSVALGFCASVLENATDGVALGSFSIATEPNTVSVGTPDATRRIVNVAAGTAATDAVNVGQLTTINTNVSNLATGLASTNATVATQGSAITSVQAVNATQQTQINTNTAQIAAFTTGFTALQNGLDTLFDLRGRDRKDMRQGIASAVAIANAPMPSAPGVVSYTLNGAAFRGELAVGGAFNYRLNTDKPMAIGVGFSSAGNKNNAVRVGVAGEF